MSEHMNEHLTEVLMPLMGEGINEATLVRWLKKPGDKIARAEPLLEVSTDKVDTEIPSPTDGFLLATYADAGATVAINSVIAFIGATADEVPAGAGAPTNGAVTKAGAASGGSGGSKSKMPAAAKTGAARQAAGAFAGAGAGAAALTPLTAASGPVRSSPLVRKIAKDHNIHLHYVPGTGLGGRITKEDILAFLDSPQAAAAVIGLPGTPQTFVAQPWEPAPLPTQIIDGKKLSRALRYVARP